MNIEDIYWHDQKLIAIEINRTNPGVRDSIELKVAIDDNPLNILFEDVYFAEFKMNFGIIAEESIRYVSIKRDDPEIPNIKRKWLKTGIELENLMCFELNTNSTDSLIKIYTLSYKIEKA